MCVCVCVCACACVCVCVCVFVCVQSRSSIVLATLGVESRTELALVTEEDLVQAGVPVIKSRALCSAIAALRGQPAPSPAPVVVVTAAPAAGRKRKDVDVAAEEPVAAGRQRPVSVSARAPALVPAPIPLPPHAAHTPRIALPHGYQILVNIPSGKIITLDVDCSDSIADVKTKIWDKTHVVSVDGMRLIYGFRQLEDNRSLADYNIQKGSTIHLVQRLAGDIGEFAPHDETPGRAWLNWSGRADAAAPQPSLAECLAVDAHVKTLAPFQRAVVKAADASAVMAAPVGSLLACFRPDQVQLSASMRERLMAHVDTHWRLHGTAAATGDGDVKVPLASVEQLAAVLTGSCGAYMRYSTLFAVTALVLLRIGGLDVLDDIPNTHMSE
jgi:hypothetical protein